ncbi:MAG: iron-containing alcohol dehydrogenase family protein, partial [Vagococcus sp.]
AYTPVSIVYNDKHEMIDMLFFSQSISLTLIDPQVLLHSPKDYLVAGIGDTLAKWYESDPILSNMIDLSVEVEIARFAAKSCQKNLLDEGKQAILDLESQTLSPSFIKVIETNIMLAGMVGGFGDKYGRTSGAHSIHDALTHIPETAKQLHGNKVAYGILVQLGFEEKWEEVNQLLPFFTDLGLPISYQELGCTNQDMEKVARLASKDEFMSLLPFEVSEEMIMTSIKRLEAMSL